MHVIQLLDYGFPAQLQRVTQPDPAVKADEVRIAIHAAAVNPLELKLASGAMREMMPLTLPWVPGIDLSGVVEALGDGVTGYQVGDPVYASLAGGGAYAERISLPAALISRKPDALSHVEAAALAGVAQTAWHALFDRGDLTDGGRVLIHGASGGVGTVAVQLARWRGATVIATASPDNAAFVLELGAHEVYDSRHLESLRDIEPVDVVIDAVGGAPQDALYAAVKPGGQLVMLTQPPSAELAQAHGVQASMLLTQPSAPACRASRRPSRTGHSGP